MWKMSFTENRSVQLRAFQFLPSTEVFYANHEDILSLWVLVVWTVLYIYKKRSTFVSFLLFNVHINPIVFVYDVQSFMSTWSLYLKFIFLDMIKICKNYNKYNLNREIILIYYINNRRIKIPYSSLIVGTLVNNNPWLFWSRNPSH